MDAQPTDLETPAGLRFWQAVSIFLGYPVLLLRQRKGNVFNELERSLSQVLLDRLDPDSSAIASSQLAQINQVSRVTARRTESNMYRIIPFRVVLDRDRMFGFPEEVHLLATIRFQLPSGLRQVAKVYVVKGILFSFELGGDMRKHFRESVQSVISFVQHGAVDG